MPQYTGDPSGDPSGDFAGNVSGEPPGVDRHSTSSGDPSGASRVASSPQKKPTAIAVSRRVSAERLVLLGWSRAILLQLAHPLVAAGVYEHSSFRTKRWAAIRRLEHTVRAMLALAFGDEAQRDRALGRIRAIHRRVHGELADDVGVFPAGTLYSAEDPDLVLWVHATMLESVPLFYELLVAPLTAEERDAYCRESASAAVALGARESEVPQSWAHLQTYMDGMYASGRIAVGAQARKLADAILSPPFGLLAAPGTWMNRLLTRGSLPDDILRQYGLAWNARDERRLARLVTMLRLLRRVLPNVLTMWRAGRRQQRIASLDDETLRHGAGRSGVNRPASRDGAVKTRVRPDRYDPLSTSATPETARGHKSRSRAPHDR